MMAAEPLARDVVEWDVENWSRAPAYWERAVALPAPPATCLELGARRGGLSLWLALKGYDVVCSDLENNETVARPLHERYGVTDRISYAAIDATQIPYENHFDIIAFKSMLGGVAFDGDIERQRRAMRSIYRALKPGGILLFAENLRGSRLHRMLRSRFVRWNAVWRYVALEEMHEFLQPFARVQYETTGVLGLCGRTPKMYTLLGRLDGAVLDRVVPEAGRYIMYGAAQK